jgi:GH15 family glucan-1,4-alpha-glucosidase
VVPSTSIAAGKTICVRSVHQEAAAAWAEADAFWSDWSRRFKPIGEWSQAVSRSLLTLKALSHRETGGIVAAGTTRRRCRKKIGGNRNWDVSAGCAMPRSRC